MRQLFIQVPRTHGQQAVEIARSHDAANLVCMQGEAEHGEVDVVLAHITNDRLESALAALQDLPDLHVSLLPYGALPLSPPQEAASQQVTDVQPRSPVEIILAGWQSIGSWGGFLGYAAAAGVVVWIGLFTETVYLLTAAMLIAPFAGPAMNTALASARGDKELLWHSITRYAAGLSVAGFTAFILTLLIGPELPTGLMVSQSNISAVTVALPLVAGAAGALHLSQSDRSSLVSGAATGVLVAASLAPPVGIIGMAAANGYWDLARAGSFVIALQLVAINLSGALIFRLYGVNWQGTRFKRGQRALLPISLTVTGLLLGGLIWWQFAGTPDLQRSSLAKDADRSIHELVRDSGTAAFVDSDVRFTRSGTREDSTLLAHVYVERLSGAPPAESLRAQLLYRITQRLLEDPLHVYPLVTVTVLEAPERLP